MLGNTQLPDLAAGARLPWRQSQPCGKLLAAMEAVDVSSSGCQGGRCQWTNPGIVCNVCICEFCFLKAARRPSM